MLSPILFVLSLWFNAGHLNAACPPNGLTLTTQGQVDSFNIHYPGCTMIQNFLVVSGRSKIKNLDSLYRITGIFGSLEITDCDSLKNIKGLRGIRFTYGSIDIANNPLLKNLIGLDSLVTLNGSYLNIRNNAAMTSLTGIDALRVDGVNYLFIRNCNQLSICNNTFVCSYLTQGGESSIGGNATGCSSILQIEKACNPSATCPSGALFFANKAEVDEFKTFYPNCHDIDGSINLQFFENYDTTSFLPFLQIHSISNRLTVYITIGMVHLIGFDSLTRVGGDLIIQGNPVLKDITGLGKLNSIGSLYIVDNHVLTDLHGLDHVSPDSVGILYIVNNPLLSTCNTPLVCSILSDREATIFGNGPGCSSPLLVLKKCFPGLDCPPGDVVFHNQSQLNEFKILYPNCTKINGSLTIFSTDDSIITSLVPLKRIKSVTGKLQVHDNNTLINFSGLDSLTEIGNGLFIEHNTSMVSLHGLDSLKKIHNDLYIYNNALLSDIQSLKSLDPNLITIIQIYSNPSLSVCNIESICQYLHLEKQAFASGNSGTCKNLVDLKKSCGIVECIPNGITFTSQADIDRFPQDYPGCNITGTLFINGADITNLDSLQQINKLTGSLVIVNCPLLKHISGLKNITKINGDIEIGGNPLLEDVDGLHALTSINGYLYLYFCPLLNNINGLQQLLPDHINDLLIELCTSLAVCNIPAICDYLNDPAHIAIIDNNAVGCNTRAQVRTSCGDVICPIGNVILTSQSAVDSFNLKYFDCSNITGDLTITGSGIVNLDSLRNVTTIGGQLRILGTSLKSLHGLENLDYTKPTRLVLQNNDSLAVCELKPICDYLSIPAHPYTIDHNAPTCNSFNAIQAECAKTCFYDGLTLTTQSQVDQFSINYPTCHIIPGALYIHGLGITHLDSLYHLTAVGGSVTIDTTSLINLKGLNALTFLGGTLSIRQNSKLTSIEDLNVHDSLNGQLNIINNSVLPNLVGLEQLSKINFQVSIRDNPKLLSLDGLNAIKSVVGTLIIQNNASLVNLTGLENLTMIGNNFTVQSNAKLKTLQGLNSLTTVTGAFRIQSNALLDSVWGLPVIKTIGRDLIIQTNSALKNLNGLTSLTDFRRTLNINGNTTLKNIKGLSNITPGFMTNLLIQNNPLLNDCHIRSICNYLNLPNKASTINGNDTSCASKIAVLNACSKIRLAIGELSFEIQRINNLHILKWRTDATSDILYFEPEFSKDGNQFKTISHIRSTSSGGSGYQWYSLNHSVNENGIYYYRLKLAEPDQSISYSRIIRINVNYFKPLIFPNPTTGELTISNLENNSPVRIEIRDMVGRSVKNVLYVKDQKLDIRNLSSGMYTIIISDHENRWVEKVIKE